MVIQPKAFIATQNWRAVCGESRTHGSERAVEGRPSTATLQCECPALFIPKVAGHSVSVEPKLINLTNLMTLCTENVTEFPKRRTKALNYEIDNVQNMHSDECVKPKIPSPVRD